MAFDNNWSYKSPHQQIPRLSVEHPSHRELSGHDYDPGHRRLDGETCSVSFLHSVASGDPFDESVMLWTRLSPSDDLLETVLPVTCKVLDLMTGVEVASVETQTSIDVDFTVKLVVGNLTASTQYSYYFTATPCAGAQEVRSDTGNTTTLPAVGSPLSRLSFGTLSCAKYTYGYFNAYARLAEKAADLDLIVFLGDYIYEYGNYNSFEAFLDPFNKKQAREPIGSAAVPNHECITLDDYRQRYALHRTDVQLQALHKALPWIIIPDDHEVADNAWSGGAANHDSSTEGDWQTRMESGLRAWAEWTPTRQFVNDTQRSYRSFAIGDLVDLIMLSTRFDDRQEQISTNYIIPPDSTDMATFNAESATKEIMSQEQMQWIDATLHNSTQAWKVLGSQVVLSDLTFPVPPYLDSDAWLGYHGSQSQLFSSMQDLDDVIVLSGDLHLGMSFSGPIRDAGDKPLYAEFATPAVCNSGAGDLADFLFLSHDTLEASMLSDNEDLTSVNLACHGYLINTFTPLMASSEMYCVDPFTADSTVDDLAWSQTVCRGTGTIVDSVDAVC